MPNIDANGISLHYEARGNPADPPIVLVMGLGVQMIVWPDPFCQMLVERGFYVVRFDNRDAGLSTQLDALGTPNIALQYMRYMMGLSVAAPYSLDDMAADTSALIGQLGLQRVHLVGASMGGMIAQNLAASLPSRVASLTSIMSTTGRRSLPKASWRTMRAILSRPAKPNDLKAAVERMMYVVNTISSRTHRPDQDRLRALCELHVARRNNPAGAARQIAAIAASDDRTKIVRQIKVPTLILHGDQDELVPYPAGLETARAIREGGGDARSVIVEGMGHDLPEPLWPRLVEEIAQHCQAADAAANKKDA
ncbi:MAG: alpha/beta hydrolase [Aeromicrobium sp.]|nr:alpha/beta hydrolase [Burkholderiales bacterium]